MWGGQKMIESDEAGFALLEVMIALVIMALVGLMAWRGMDAMIRGREVIDRRANADASYSQLVRQFERDCQESLRREEIAPLFASSGISNSANVAGASASSTLASLVTGAKNIWWIRRYRSDNQDAWLIVGYGMTPNGLQRISSRPLLRRSDAGVLWASIVRDPDLISSELLVSLDLPSIVKQTFQVKTSVVSGAGGSGISASGTGTPTNSAAAAINPTVSPINPDLQGIVMQWWLKDTALPITRACLMGGAL